MLVLVAPLAVHFSPTPEGRAAGAFITYVIAWNYVRTQITIGTLQGFSQTRRKARLRSLLGQPTKNMTSAGIEWLLGCVILFSTDKDKTITHS